MIKRKRYTHTKEKERKNNLALKIHIHSLDEVYKAVLCSFSATGHPIPEKVKKPNGHQRPRDPSIVDDLVKIFNFYLLIF